MSLPLYYIILVKSEGVIISTKQVLTYFMKKKRQCFPQIKLTAAEIKPKSK